MPDPEKLTSVVIAKAAPQVMNTANVCAEDMCSVHY